MRWNDPEAHELDRIHPSTPLAEIQKALIQRGWHLQSKPLLVIDGVAVYLGDLWWWHHNSLSLDFTHKFWDALSESWCRQTIYWHIPSKVWETMLAIYIKSLIYSRRVGITYLTVFHPNPTEVTTQSTSTISALYGRE